MAQIPNQFPALPPMQASSSEFGSTSSYGLSAFKLRFESDLARRFRGKVERALRSALLTNAAFAAQSQHRARRSRFAVATALWRRSFRPVRKIANAVCLRFQRENCGRAVAAVTDRRSETY